MFLAAVAFFMSSRLEHKINSESDNSVSVWLQLPQYICRASEASSDERSEQRRAEEMKVQKYILFFSQ